MRAICVGYIELVRGVPLITVLFMASVMLPLFLPTGMTIDKLLRAQVAFILFAAAYLAEVIRGGLQAIPRGQIEAADSLGLGYWRRTRLIVLPQALAMVIPPLVNTFIGAFKNTSLVIIIGLFDLLGTANAALTDANWQGFYVEAYVVHRGDLLELLLLHVALQPDARARVQQGPAALGRRGQMTDSAVGTRVGEPIIELRHVDKWYGEFHALKDINLEVKKGERVVVCGPSGSGKSTMIRCINRLEEHQQGQIIVAGIELTADVKNIEAIRREVGMVFQQFNLFPHLTVLENLTLAPIWVRKLPRKEAEETARLYLERVRIPEQADKYPGQLSGGQQQRVAIARSLCMKPEIMLFDEPTSALDPGDDQGSARRHDRARRGGHDDGVRDPRDGFRADCRRYDGLYGLRRDRRARRRRRSFSPTPRTTAPSCSSARSSLTEGEARTGIPLRETGGSSCLLSSAGDRVADRRNILARPCDGAAGRQDRACSRQDQYRQ